MQLAYSTTELGEYEKTRLLHLLLIYAVCMSQAGHIVCCLYEIQVDIPIRCKHVANSLRSSCQSFVRRFEMDTTGFCLGQLP